MSAAWRAVEEKNPPTLQSRRSTMAWLWRMRCGLDDTFHDPYTSVCNAVASYSSDCGKSKNAITCRRIRGIHPRTDKLRKTVKKR
jgi:hypothetical protein